MEEMEKVNIIINGLFILAIILISAGIMEATSYSEEYRLIDHSCKKSLNSIVNEDCLPVIKGKISGIEYKCFGIEERIATYEWFCRGVN